MFSKKTYRDSRWMEQLVAASVIHQEDRPHYPPFYVPNEPVEIWRCERWWDVEWFYVRRNAESRITSARFATLDNNCIKRVDLEPCEWDRFRITGR